MAVLICLFLLGLSGGIQGLSDRGAAGPPGEVGHRGPPGIGPRGPKMPEPIPTCHHTVDLGFILDSSGSLENEYDQEKQFIKMIAKSFSVEKGKTHVGVVTFSGKAELSFKLSDTSSYLAFKEAVDNIRFMGGSTRIDLALEKAKDHLFSKTNGGRGGTKKVLVLLTDGKDGSGVDLASIADALRDQEVELLVIGIGAHTNEAELKRIAGPRDDYRSAENFAELASEEFAKKMTKRLCEIVTSVNCHHPVDLGFILDSSGTLKNEYGQEKHFIKMIANSFGVQKGRTHTGVVTFSSKAELSIKLSDTSDYAKFEHAVDNIRNMGGLTRIDLALQKAKDHLFSKKNGGREKVKKVLVMLTDGAQTYTKDAVNPVPLAEALRKQGVILLVIGIGARINKAELKQIAGPRDDYRLVKDFAELSSKEVVQKITKKLCNTATAPVCKKIVDVCFLLDASASIDELTEWVKVKEFVRSLSNSFQFSETGSRGSIVVFSDSGAYTKVVLKLDDKFGASDFGQATDSIPYIGYRTRMDLGFKLADEVVFKEKNGARDKNVHKIIILITDGVQNPPQYDPVSASLPLLKRGVDIYAIAIGNNVDFGQLRRITRNPDRVFPANSFLSLSSAAFVKSVSKETCPIVHPCDKDNGGCDDQCDRTTNAATCKCTPPKVLGADGKSCVHPCDKDNGGCDDQCDRTTNAATCKCTPPKVLGADGKSCDSGFKCIFQPGEGGRYTFAGTFTEADCIKTCIAKKKINSDINGVGMYADSSLRHCWCLMNMNMRNRNEDKNVKSCFLEKYVSCSSKYKCEFGKGQYGTDILSTTRTGTRNLCAEKCCATKDCTGFDWNSKKKDCYLTKSPRTVVPLRYRRNFWSCEKTCEVRAKAAMATAEHPTFNIKFTNANQGTTVCISWKSYSAKEVPISFCQALRYNESCRLYTYGTHSFLARDCSTKKLLYIRNRNGYKDIIAEGIAFGAQAGQDIDLFIINGADC